MMRRLYKPIFISVFLCLLAAFCSSCAPAAEPALSETSVVVGFTQSGSESRWRKAGTENIITELERQSYRVIYRNCYMDFETQLKDIRNFIVYKVDIIVISPLQSTGYDAVLAEAQAAGIPVFIVDETLETAQAGLYKTHIGPNFRAEGNKAGLYLVNRAKTGYFHNDPVGGRAVPSATPSATESKINVLELSGSRESSSAMGRAEGFREVISQNKDIAISATIFGDFIRKKGEEAFTEYAESHDIGDVDVIFSHNDEMTLGALDAIAALNKKRAALGERELVPGKDILFISVDAQAEAVELLKTGSINCIVECNPFSGWYIANAINKYLDNGNIVSEIYIPETVFSDQGDLDVIPTRNY